MICKKCGGLLRHRDYVKRIIKTKNGKTDNIKVERLMCQKCGCLVRNLPPTLSPYKHYENDVIEGVREGIITSDTLGYENYPSEITMKRWKK